MVVRPMTLLPRSQTRSAYLHAVPRRGKMFLLQRSALPLRG